MKIVRNLGESAPAGSPGRWIVAGTPASEPYPCRCHEAKYGRCHPTFCPCSGRTDPVGPECCANWNTPEVAARASEEYRLRRAHGEMSA